MVAVLGFQAALLGSAVGGAPAPVSGFGEVNRVGASVNYDGHPSIAPSAVGMQDQYEANFRYYDDAIRSTLGLPAGTKVLAGPHRFQSSVPSNWSSVALRWASPDYNWGLQNMQIPYTQWAGPYGGLDSTVTSLLNSVPADFTLICAFAHEPENNGPFPSADGGTWQNTYGPAWSQMQAHLAELFVTLNKPNCWLTVIHMGDTFPLATGTPGALGNNQKDASKWNPWQYMSAAAKARTIFGPDVYTKMLDDAGTSSSYTKLGTRHGNIVNYVTASGWGVQRIAVSEHTINNDILASDAHVAAAIRDDMRVYLRGLKSQGKLAYYAHFNTSDTGGASGANGWFDDPQELTEFGGLVREINVGSSGTGTTGVAFKAASGNTANNSAPSVPLVGAVGDYAVVQFSCNITVTLTDPAGWTVHVSTDSGSCRTRVYGKFLTGTETTTNVLPTMGGTTSRWAAQMIAYSGVHATPINGTPGVATDNATNTVHSTGTTTAVPGCTILSLATDRSGTAVVTSWTAPAGYTGRSSVVQTVSAGATAAAADKSNVAIGTYGGDTWTSDVAAAAFVGVTLALRPA